MRASRAAAMSSFESMFPRAPRLRGKPAHAQHTLGAIRLQVGAAEKAVAGEQRQDVVPVDALGLALVDLDHMLEAEEPLEQRPVPHQVVERAHQHRRRRGAVELRLRHH